MCSGCGSTLLGKTPDFLGGKEATLIAKDQPSVRRKVMGLMRFGGSNLHRPNNFLDMRVVETGLLSALACKKGLCTPF